MDETAGELFRVQRINGVPLPLGSMPYHQLVDVYTQTKLRENAARDEGALVMRYMTAGDDLQPDTHFPVIDESQVS